MLLYLLDYQTEITPLAKSPIPSDQPVYLILIVLKVIYVLSEVVLPVWKVDALISIAVTHGETGA